MIYSVSSVFWSLMCILNQVLFFKFNILALCFVSETSVIFSCIRPLKCTSLKTVTSVAEICRRYTACIIHSCSFVGSDMIFVTTSFLNTVVLTFCSGSFWGSLHVWMGKTARSLPARTWLNLSNTIWHWTSHTHTHTLQTICLTPLYHTRAQHLLCFDSLLTVQLSIFISATKKLDAQNFCLTISLFHASTCFEHMCSSSGGKTALHTLRCDDTR